MAVTNWKSVGESVHQGDMDRARLALERRRLAMAEQAQQFNQQRQMYQDAEAKRIGERAYQDSRADLKYNRDFAERDYADRRGDVQHNRAFAERGYQDQRGDTQYSRAVAERGYQDSRADTQYNRAVAERGYQDSRSDRQYDRDFAERGYQAAQDVTAFNQMLAQEKHNQQTALYEQEMLKHQEMFKQRENEKMMRSASLASLLANGFMHGDRDEAGNIFVPVDNINLFNQSVGMDGKSPNALRGLTILTRDRRMNTLNAPQIVLMYNNGQNEVMNGDVLKGLANSFPGILTSLKSAFPNDADNWAMSLGLVQPQQERGVTYDRTLADYYKSKAENASKRLSASYSSVREGAGAEDREALKRAEAEQMLFLKTGYMPTEEEVDAYLNPDKPKDGGNAIKDVDLQEHNPHAPLGATRTRRIRTSN